MASTEPTVEVATRSVVGHMRFSTQSCSPWSAKKPKRQFTAVGALACTGPHTTLVGLIDGESRLAVWSPLEGLKTVKDAPTKGLDHAGATMACDGLHSALFVTRHGGTCLQFVLLTHDPKDPSHLSAKPHTVSDELQRALTATHTQPADKKAPKPTFAVHHTCLRVYENGAVLVAAMVQNVTAGQHYLLVGDVVHTVWHAWPLSAAFTKTPCIVLPSRFRDVPSASVRALRAEIGAPLNRRLAVSAPTVPLALSVFDNVTTAMDNDDATTSGETTQKTSQCLLVLDATFSWCTTTTTVGTADPASEWTATQQCFQSQCFPIESQSTDLHNHAASDVRLYASSAGEQTFNALVTLGDKSKPTYTSYVVQMRHSVACDELISCCHPLPRGNGQLICTTTLALPPRPGRVDGARVLLALTSSSDLYACEEFGGDVDVAVGPGAEVHHGRLTLSVPAVAAQTRKNREKPGQLDAVLASDCEGVRLLPLVDGRAACVTGRVCALLCPEDVHFDGTAAPPPKSGVLVDERSVADSRAHVRRCVALLARGATSASTRPSPHELATVLFRDILPSLAAVGTAQEEVRLVQECYESFLALARCETQEDWLYLWTLTSILQRFLAHRTQSHNLSYTDRFFLELANRQRLVSAKGTSISGSTEASAKRQLAEAAHEGVRAVLSQERTQTQRDKPQSLPDELQYVLEGLVAGEAPLLAFAAEIVRRYVETSTLSNGACVVRAKPGLASCVHVVGAALAASCFDVPLYVSATAQQGLMWSVTQPEGSTSVYLVPQVYGSKREFDQALTMSADMLGVASTDETFRPDIVFLILAMSRRTHCLAALVHLFGPILKEEVRRSSPLADNTQWMQDCVALVVNHTSTESLAASAFAGDSRVNVCSSLFYAVTGAGAAMNEPLFHSVSTVLSGECAAVMVVMTAFTATSHLLQQQHHATVAAVAVTSSPAGQLEVTERAKLRAACSRATHLWSQVGRYLPYSLSDVATSYCATVQQSLVPPSARQRDVSEGTTVALRTAVMCFRLTALVVYAAELESRLAGLSEAAVVVPPETELDEHAPLVQDMLDALRITLLLGSKGTSPWPASHIHALFLLAVRVYSQAIVPVHPEWVVFFRRLLDVCANGLACCASTTISSELARLKASLTALASPLAGRERNDQAFARAQRCGAQAEAVAAHLLSSSANAAPSPPQHFAFSPAADLSLPHWPWLTALEPNRQTASTACAWVSNLWCLEEQPEMLEQLANHLLRGIDKMIDTQPQTRGATGAVDAPPLSPTFLLPMYGAICEVLPPVRAHATLREVPPAGRLSVAPQQPCSRPVKTTPGEPNYELSASPARAMPDHDGQSAPLLQMSTPPVATNDEKSQHSVHARRPPPRTLPDSPSAAAAADNNSKSGGFSPAAVAWWETDNNASRQTATTFDVSDTASSSSSSATSYTTATTAATNAAPENERPRSRGDDKRTNRRHDNRGDSRTGVSGCPRCGHCACHHHRARDDHPHKRVCAAARHGDVVDDVRVLGPLGSSLAPRHAWSEVSRDVGAPRAQLLQFTRQLRPPQEPRCHSARAATPPALAGGAASHRRSAQDTGLGHPQNPTMLSQRRPQSARVVGGAAGNVPALLTLKSSGAGGADQCRASSLMRPLLDARGLQPPQQPPSASHAFSATQRAAPFLSTATAQASLRYMDPPPLPPSSVYAAPPPLLHFRSAPEMGTPGTATGSTGAPLVTHPSTAPATRAPTAVSDAVVLSFDERGVHQVPSEPTAQPPQPQVPCPPPAAAAPAVVASPPTPSLPQRTLNPTELADFRRYTDELVAANRAAAERLREDRATAATTPPQPLPPSAAPEIATGETAVGADWSSSSRSVPLHPLDSVKREHDFITQAQKIMEQREKENERFYERVTDSVRSISSVIERSRQERHGLHPAEQSELLRSSIHQKNELLTLNRQLLDLQLAAARSGDAGADDRWGAGAAGQAPHFSVGTSTTSPELAVGSTQTVSPPRPTMQDGGTSMPARTQSAETAASGKTMEDTFEDLRRLNAQLLTMNTSAEAMDKAIRETREAVKRYEALGSVERMNADGLALLHSLQHRTAAVEHRLADLPRPYASGSATADSADRPSSPRATATSSRWKSNSTIFTPYDTTPAAGAGTPPSVSVSRRFTSTAVTPTEPGSSPSEADRDGEPRRNTQPPPEAAPEESPQRRSTDDRAITGVTTDSVGHPLTDRHQLPEEERRPFSDESTPHLPSHAFSIGGSSPGGRAEIVSIEALLGHDDGRTVSPLRDRLRSVTFQDTPEQTRAHVSAVPAYSLSGEVVVPPSLWTLPRTGVEHSPSPARRTPRASHDAPCAPVRRESASVVAPVAQPQPRIFTAPADLMSVYRNAAKHPREAAGRTGQTSHRASLHATSRESLPPRRPTFQSLSSVSAPDPSTGARGASRRSTSMATATSDRFAMYAPSAAPKSTKKGKAVPPKRLDARSLAVPADSTDLDLFSTNSRSASQRQRTHSTRTVEDKFAARRESRRDQSINQRIAMLEREFQ